MFFSLPGDLVPCLMSVVSVGYGGDYDKTDHFHRKVVLMMRQITQTYSSWGSPMQHLYKRH